jgi:hypothetical protein
VTKHPYQKGGEARGLGQAQTSNPHAAGTEKHAEWDNGWQAVDRLLQLAAKAHGGPSHG